MTASAETMTTGRDVIAAMIALIKTKQIRPAEAKALEVAAALLVNMPSNGLPSEMERERLSRTTRLPDGMMEAYYRDVAEHVRDTDIKVSLVAVDDYRHRVAASRGVYAYACDDDALLKLLTRHDGNAEATIIATY